MEKWQTPAPSAVPPQCASVEACGWVGGCIHMHMLQRHLRVFVCAGTPIIFFALLHFFCVHFDTHTCVCARAVR